MKTFTFLVASCGTEPRLMEWDHITKEAAVREMERKGYKILNYLGEGY